MILSIPRISAPEIMKFFRPRSWFPARRARFGPFKIQLCLLPCQIRPAVISLRPWPDFRSLMSHLCPHRNFQSGPLLQLSASHLFTNSTLAEWRRTPQAIGKPKVSKYFNNPLCILQSMLNPQIHIQRESGMTMVNHRQTPNHHETVFMAQTQLQEFFEVGR